MLRGHTRATASQTLHGGHVCLPPPSAPHGGAPVLPHFSPSSSPSGYSSLQPDGGKAACLTRGLPGPPTGAPLAPASRPSCMRHGVASPSLQAAGCGGAGGQAGRWVPAGRASPTAAATPDSHRAQALALGPSLGQSPEGPGLPPSPSPHGVATPHLPRRMWPVSASPACVRGRGGYLRNPLEFRALLQPFSTIEFPRAQGPRGHSSRPHETSESQALSSPCRLSPSHRGAERAEAQLHLLASPQGRRSSGRGRDQLTRDGCRVQEGRGRGPREQSLAPSWSAGWAAAGRTRAESERCTPALPSPDQPCDQVVASRGR